VVCSERRRKYAMKRDTFILWTAAHAATTAHAGGDITYGRNHGADRDALQD
jgi:hypothetical protein